MNHKPSIVRILLALLVTALAGCSKSPTEPKQTPATPVPPVPVASFVVTVTANPGALAVGNVSGSTITVTVRSADSGAPPPDGTPVKLTTTLGEFGNQGSGLQTLTLQLVGGRAQTVLFPGSAAGTAAIQAQLQLAGASGSGAATVAINQATTFFVGSISPSVGSPKGGDQVTITGGGFVSPVRVTFNAAAATVLSVTPTRIVAVVPSSTAAGVSVGVGQSVPVTVSVTINVNQAGTATDSLNNGFTYSFGGTVEQPQIFSISPATGANSGGTRVTIVGTGFSSPVQVFFEGGNGPSGKVALEASVVSVTATQIVVLSPPAQGFGNDLQNSAIDIRVKNLNTGFETTAVGAFRYGSQVLITSFGPGQLLYNDTTTLITIQGQGFEAPVAASIANVAARVVSVSGTEVVVQSPGVLVTSCANVTGPVSVVNINTGNSASSTAQFIYLVPKTSITSIQPTSGPQGGGTPVTVSGSGFAGPSGLNDVRVVFGDQGAPVQPGGTPGSVVVVLSPPFSGAFPTQTCTIGGVQGTMNVAASVDVKVTNLATTCSDTFPKSFFYQPTDNGCHVVPPKASFTDVISGLMVTFTDTTSGNPTSWAWNFGDSTTSTAQNPSHSYTAAGTYTVTLTVSNPGGSSSASMAVTVM